MGFTVDTFNLAKSKMLGDFNKAFTDAEVLRQAEMEASDKEPAAAPAVIEEKPGGAGANSPVATPAPAIAVAGK
jgi:hypothetical protein